MRQIILICYIFFTFTLHFQLSAKTIWEENFNIPGKGNWANGDGILQSDFTGVVWSLNVSKCKFVNEGDYAKTVATNGGRFEVLDSDGDVVWFSPVIDISGYSVVNASVITSETGSSTAIDKKFIKASYLLDGVISTFSPDSIVSGNWGEKTLTARGIKGNLLQLVITMNSSYSADKVIIDDVVVEGTDSTLFEPHLINIYQLPSYSFTNEVTTISAFLIDKRGEVITDKRYGLTFQSNQMVVTDSSFGNGYYSWNVISDSVGKSFFTIDFENPLVESLNGFIQFYKKENLLLSENFEKDGLNDWHTNGVWEISLEMPISGKSSLKHLIQSGNGASTFSNNHIGWSLGNGNYHFSFKLKNGNWDPSSSNLFFLSLCHSDSTIISSQGYAIGVNAAGSSDLVTFWALKNGLPEAIVVETTFDWNENTSAQIDLYRDGAGNWELMVTDLKTGLYYSGKGLNDAVADIDQISLNFKYSQTRSGQLWFDDLVVLRENLPPEIKWVKTLSDGRVQVCFCEDVKIDKLTTGNFNIESKQGKNYSIEFLEFTGLDTITFLTSPIDEVDLLITAFNIEDSEGAVSDSLKFIFEYQLPVSQFDLVVTEIMADPTPFVGLPGSEFVEIFNRCEKIIDLKDWEIAVNDKISTLPTCKINPGEYIIVCNAEDSALFSPLGVVLSVKNFPALINSGALIKISSQWGETIDSVTYSDNWFNDTQKRNGGWSLEKIDPDRQCGEKNNWAASENILGGTPARTNSVNAPNIDNNPPVLLQIVLLSTTRVEITFDETIDADSIGNISVSGGLKIDSIQFEIGHKSVVVIFHSEIKGNTLYNLMISEVADECDNIGQNFSVSFSRQIVTHHDLLISEVLFNPLPGGYDFVEVYNNSGIDIDISKLKLATRNDTLGLKSVYPLSSVNIFFPDRSYMVFTRDRENIVSSYWTPYPERILEMESFPSYPDDNGHVVLLNDSLEVIDEFAYSEGMQSKWLSDLNGVSLERLSFTGETNDPFNWYSASSRVGYATPGYENSQKEPYNPVGVSVLINPDAISPNSDGYNDEMGITFKTGKPGYLANVSIFDIKGRRVKRLLNNDLVGSEEKINFNGNDESGGRLPMGIYILLSELVHPDGDRKIFKQAFLVTDKR